MSWSTRSACLLICLTCLVTPSVTRGQRQSVQIRSSVQMLGDNAPYSFPEKAVVAPGGNVYVLDTALSNVFLLDMGRGKVSALCAPRLPFKPSDLSVDASGGVWVLSSSRSKIFKLGASCEVQKVFDVRRPSLHLAANSSGEIAVLALKGDALFDLYDRDGKLLKSFGERIKYDNPAAESELNDGRLLPDRSGGFFFSFNYPPLIRHYGRGGRLLGEFRPESNIEIGTPDVSSTSEGGMITVRSRYRLLVTDMALDSRGRLFLLLSGKDKYQALVEGSADILVTTAGGRTLKKLAVADGEYHHLAVGPDALFLVRNRRPLRFEMYTLP